VVYLACSLAAAFSGETAAAGSSVMEGAQAAVSFCLSITGSLCLWSAVMELMQQCGISAGLSRLLSPLLSRLFPGCSRDEEIMSSLSENVSANLLGLGNAATPAGIRAAKGMARRAGGLASDELCMLVVINTASIQLLPTTIASVRAAAGAASPFDITPAVLISSFIALSTGLIAAGILRKLRL